MQNLFCYFWSNFPDCSLHTGGYGSSGPSRNLELVITIFSVMTLKLLHWKLNAGLPTPDFHGNFRLTPSWAGRGNVACTQNWCFILTSRAELQIESRNLTKSLLMFFSPKKHLNTIFQSADGRWSSDTAWHLWREIITKCAQWSRMIPNAVSSVV